MRSITPIDQMQRRMPEAGRIRIGVKSGKAMKAIDTFRFTSQDSEAINAIAEIYGGTPAPWDGGRAKNQHEVITDASEIQVILPPDPLGGSPVYELWSGGGIQRRCDGEVCTMPVQGPDGMEMGDGPCLCIAADKLDCKPTTRLNVLLPNVRFGGTWRLEAKGWNAAKELPGMVDMVQALQAKGLPYALLAIEKRTSVQNGQTRNFVVPVLRLTVSPNEMLAGASAAPQLDITPQRRELHAANVIDFPPPDPDDDIAEVEFVEADDGAPTADTADVNGKMRTKIAIHCRELFASDADLYRHALACYVSGQRTESTKELDQQELGRMLDGLGMIAAGTVKLGWDGEDLIVRQAEGSA